MRKIALALIFILLCATPSFAVTEVIKDIGDAWALPAGSALCYGHGNNLFVGNLSGTVRRSYFLFNVSVIPNGAIIDSAIFSVYSYGVTTPGLIAAYNTSPYNTTGTSTFWNEGTLYGTSCGSGVNCNLDHNLTGNNQPAVGTLQSSVNVSTASRWYNFTVTDAVTAANGTADMLSLALRQTNESIAIAGWYNFYQYEYSGGIYQPYLTVTYHLTDCAAQCGVCGCTADETGCYVPPTVGSYCDSTDPDHQGIITTLSDCTSSYYTCPNSTVCSQITPQVNITSPLVENFVDCSACWFAKVWSVQNGWKTLYTNCPNNPECDNCNGIYCVGNNFVTNLSSIPASANYYTAGCYNPDTQTVIDIIDQNGNHTSVQNLTESVFPGSNYTYNGTCSNTSTKCYSLIGGVCQEVTCPNTASTTSTSFMGILALGMGSAFGITDLAASEWIFSMVIALAVGIFIVFFTRTGLHFAIGMLGTLIMFTLIGWFPGWVMIMLIVISAYLVARQMGVIGE